MELIRHLKKLIRSHPHLLNILQPPVLAATMALRRYRRRRWYGARGIFSEAQAGQWIADRIHAREPAAMGKVGTLELELLVLDESGLVRTQDFRNAVKQTLQFEHRPSAPQELRRLAFVNVGIFPPTDTVIWGFLDELRTTLLDVDALAVWGNPGEETIVKRYCDDAAVLTVSGAFEPWKQPQPWSKSLAGKRVLVVHPFAKTIGEQYRNSRDAIWRSHPPVLPHFDLVTLRMPLSAGLVEPEESDWCARLVKMKAQMDQIEFDVALIGAGGMSLPLAVHAKRLGRIGIHMGGSTQVLFGIKGRRFDDDEAICRAYNESWVRPASIETPQGAAAIEGGCYW